MANFYQGYADFQPLVDTARNQVLPTARGFSLNNRLKNGMFDCSSFVSTSLNKLPGFDYIKPYFTTQNYDPANPNNAFAGRKDWQWVQGSEGVMPGDILWRKGHMEIATGGNNTIGAHSTRNGVSEYNRQPPRTYSGYWRYTGDQSAFRQPMQASPVASQVAQANPQTGLGQTNQMVQAQPSPQPTVVVMPMAQPEQPRGLQGYLPSPRPMVHSRASAQLLNRFLSQMGGQGFA